MMTLVQKTATVRPDGRMDFAVPELPPGTTADVIVVVPPPAPQVAPPELTVADRLAALHALQQSMNLSDEDAENWRREVRAERLAWNRPPDANP